MLRNIDEIKRSTFDVLIIGSGIHGAAAAWQCAAQGLKVAIIDKNDFGSVTSANSLKIIHGGFRYLQHLNIKRMRESIISRRIMFQIAPHNVKALRCIIPTSGWGLRSRFLMRIALFLNDIIAFDRNRDIGRDSEIPNGKIFGINKCRQLFAAIDWRNKTGGAAWYDAIAMNSERLTLAFIKKAVSMGGCAANYLEMKRILVEDGVVSGCEVYDSITDHTLRIKAKSVVVAGGANNDRLLGVHQDTKEIQRTWAKAVNIIVKKELLGDSAIGLTGEIDYVDSDAVIKKKGRFFFFVPWRGYTMIGTTYTADSSDPVKVKGCNRDVEEILTEVNTIFPKAELSVSDVSKIHAGLVPAYPQGNREDIQLVKETSLSDLGEKFTNPVAGLYAVRSVKYTTAPVVAMDVARRITEFLGTKYHKIGSVHHTSNDRLKKRSDTFSDSSTMLDRYGHEAKIVMKYLLNDGKLICENSHVYTGEVDFFVKEEMAQTLGDVVFRRSEIATAECPERNILEKIAERMALHLHWDKDRIKNEVDAVEKSFIWK